MSVLKCKMCGGNVMLLENQNIGVCESCGCAMTLPSVDDEHRAEMFNRGNHFRRIGEFDKALAIYEQIVYANDADAEAHWCCVLCRFGIEYVEDPITLDWIPTCHRASYDNILQDIDYLAAIENSEGIIQKHYQREARKIAEIQKNILATSVNEEPFDIFICYKESEEDGTRTRDSIMAQDIYYQLTDKGYRVFFARITLEDKAGTEYEPYIFSALNSAKVMIVVGTSKEHLDSVWVKNEWSRFLSLMRKDRSKLILPCYKDMDPYDLPEALSILQSYDMSKIGFVQDLLHGIDKVTGGAESKSSIPQPQVITEIAAEMKIDPMLKRIYIFLEGKEWDKADEYCEKVLDLQPECAEAYFLKILTEEKCRNLQELLSGKNTGYRNSKNYIRMLQFDKEKDFSEPLQRHLSKIDEMERQKQQAEEAERQRKNAEIERKKQGYYSARNTIVFQQRRIDAAETFIELKKDYDADLGRLDLLMRNREVYVEELQRLRGPFSGKQRSELEGNIEALDLKIGELQRKMEDTKMQMEECREIAGGEICEAYMDKLNSDMQMYLRVYVEAEQLYKQCLDHYNMAIPQELDSAVYLNFVNQVSQTESLKQLKRKLEQYNIPSVVEAVIEKHVKLEMYSRMQKKECAEELKQLQNYPEVQSYDWSAITFY